MSNHQDLVKKVRSDLEILDTVKELEELKTRYFGKKGIITELLKSLGGLPVKERRQTGIQIHSLKVELESIFSKKHEEIITFSIQKQIKEEVVDVTLPSRNSGLKGSSHPIQTTLGKIINIFSRIGFECVNGPEIEDEFHNFEALNISEDHPARAMHDTFYLINKKLLRTHTSPVQIRYMVENNPPFAMIAPGKVYRCDYDQTHTPMFHQVEGLFVDYDVNLSNLKGLITEFLQIWKCDFVRLIFLSLNLLWK